MVKFSDFDVCQSFVHKDKAKILSYISLLYDRESSLNGIQNLSDRKREACSRAKLDARDPEIISIMDMQHEQVNKLIFAYLSQFQNSNAYHKLCSDQQLFWDIQKILMSPGGTDDEDKLMEKYKKRGDLSKTADQLLTTINKLFSEIYKDDDVQEVAATMMRQMLRPEDRVRQKERTNV